MSTILDVLASPLNIGGILDDGNIEALRQRAYNHDATVYPDYVEGVGSTAYHWAEPDYPPSRNERYIDPSLRGVWLERDGKWGFLPDRDWHVHPERCWRCGWDVASTYESRSAYFGITRLSSCCGAKVLSRS